ncbi:MAG: hypothetical protein KAF42_01740 [Sphingopyxis terrae]|nr:hypothetical protein [Sphingopyxis terrae]
MGKLVQRKAFDHPAMALEAEAAFHAPGFAIPGIEISTKVVEQEGQVWLILSQKGGLVTNIEAVLPDWELVSFEPDAP